MNTAERYRRFATVEARGNSPEYERLALAVAADPRLTALLDARPAAERQPNLLFGAVRYLGGDLDPAWIAAHWPAVAAILASKSTQTNEPGRCAVLVPTLAALPQPLALIEVGASAGLCLYPDRYGYDYGPHGTLGDGADPVLRCLLTGTLPLALPQVVWRAGLDLNPLDVRDESAVRWLDALIWPGQGGRRARLRAAARVAAADLPLLVRGDLLADLPALAAQAPPDATLVIFHSAVLGYVAAETRTAFAQLTSTLGAHWLSNEAPGVLAGTGNLDGVPPGAFVLALDGQPIAHTGPHGQWLTELTAG